MKEFKRAKKSFWFPEYSVSRKSWGVIGFIGVLFIIAVISGSEYLYSQTSIDRNYTAVSEEN